MNTQDVLDWRLVHGSGYRYDDIQAATGVSRKRLYRMRAACTFGKHGLFTYGEALAMVYAQRAHINVYRPELATLVIDLAWKIDHADVDHFHVYVCEHIDGTHTAHGGGEAVPTTAVVTTTVHLAALALTLANAHARLHTVTE